MRRLQPGPGFTLIELLVVMAIVSILAAIAVPQYQAYRARGFDLRAQSDLHNTALAEEAYYIDHEEYLSCSGSGCTALPGIAALSKDVVLEITAQPTRFIGRASHPKGTGRSFLWDSEAGGFVDEGEPGGS